MIYFKTYARENGCPESTFKSDLAVWEWIKEFQTITIWEACIPGVWPKDGWGPQTEDTWNFNHIDKGYDEKAVSPTPKSPKFKNQAKAWKGQTWRSFKAKISCYNVVTRV